MSSPSLETRDRILFALLAAAALALFAAVWWRLLAEGIPRAG